MPPWHTLHAALGWSSHVKAPHPPGMPCVPRRYACNAAFVALIRANQLGANQVRPACHRAWLIALYCRAPLLQALAAAGGVVHNCCVLHSLCAALRLHIFAKVWASCLAPQVRKNAIAFARLQVDYRCDCS